MGGSADRRSVLGFLGCEAQDGGQYRDARVPPTFSFDLSGHQGRGIAWRTDVVQAGFPVLTLLLRGEHSSSRAQPGIIRGGLLVTRTPARTSSPATKLVMCGGPELAVIKAHSPFDHHLRDRFSDGLLFVLPESTVFVTVCWSGLLD